LYAHIGGEIDERWIECSLLPDPEDESLDRARHVMKAIYASRESEAARANSLAKHLLSVIEVF
jgi:hypothetical protein